MMEKDVKRQKIEERSWKMGSKRWKKKEWNWKDFAGKSPNRGKSIIYYNKNRYKILYQILR